MKCPHCGKDVPQPTYKQMEAYLLVHVYGYTHTEAGNIADVHRTTIGRRVAAVGRFAPKLLPTAAEKVRLRKKLSYDDHMSYKTSHRF